MIGYLDCSTGVSGDKFLGALLDVGVATGAFTAEDLQALLARLAPEARVTVARVSSHGVSALSVSVQAAEQPASRTWASIRDDLAAAGLPDAVRKRAVAVFSALAEAEAGVHGTDVDSVHFHEVGALDSLLDVVGTCAALHALGIDRLVASPLATGWGTVAASHGVLPVPAPATAALLLGLETVAGPSTGDGEAPGELTTPTGAALVRVLASGFGPCDPLVPHHIGYGAGTREIGSPNVCRIIVGEPATATPSLRTEQVTLLETNVDHISAEASAFAAEQLLAEGALDVWLSPIVMKKGRAGHLISVLAATGDADRLAERLVALTGTLGVRRHDLPRYVAEREQRVIDTAYGPVRVKVGPPGASPRYRPEHDDVARIARETGRAFPDVAEELETLAIDALEAP